MNRHIKEEILDPIQISMLGPPRHLPIFIAAVTSLFLHADAGKSHSYKTQHAVQLATPALDPHAVVRLTKNLYRDLGLNDGNVTTTAEKYRAKFRDLNVTADGQLEKYLASVFEIRMLDLQASIRHAKQMQAVIEELAAPNPQQ